MQPGKYNTFIKLLIVAYNSTKIVDKCSSGGTIWPSDDYYSIQPGKYNIITSKCEAYKVYNSPGPV